PRNVVADSIVADLDRAISMLKPRPSAAAMRINKEIAQAFKTRVCLYEGTWEKYHNGTPFGVQGQDGSAFLQKAADEAEALMQSPSVGLDNVGAEDGYGELFNQVDYGSSKEVLFWRKYQIGVLTTFWNRYSNTGGGTGMSKNLVESFLCTDGNPITVSPLYEGDATLTDVVKNRDPRLKQILYTPGDLVTTNTADRIDILFSNPGFTLAIDQRNTTGYQLQKGNNTDAAQIDYTTRGLIYIRYGEVLLNFAEAKAELGTLTQADADKSINLLRERVGMPPMVIAAITSDPDWAFTDLSPVINEVRRERRVELSCEGFRFDDIMRWAAADELIKGYKYKGAKWAQWDGEFPTLVPGVNIFLDAEGYIEPFQQDQLLANGFQFDVNRDYLLPLPVDQLTLNPALGQNPGW
ncbi:MAG TPA: RagB/SusD family nutrient uptake outer membrane protein, partial [Agriterribacter sp.]|nr:RagB/SusD family nutrient uptake outer membrane protein [Agriterribacter sp.]